MQTPTPSRPSAGAFYRAVWRWHFYAGLACLPFLVMLAVTGALYLFKAEIDHAVYRAWENVPARSTPALSASEIAAKVGTAMGGRVLVYTPPQNATDAARLIVRVEAAGESRSAFADPYDGHLLGSTEFGGVMQTIRKVHSLQRFGFYANCVIEIVAGWTLVLMATGVYLWWPRGGRSRRGAALRATPKTRAFWRDFHALTGVLAAAVIMFLAATGMPWSAVWGKTVQRWATARGLGRPAPPPQVAPPWTSGKRLAPRGHDRESGAADHSTHDGMTEEARNGLPWSLQRASPPASDSSAGKEPVSLEQAVEIFNGQGLERPFSVSLPTGPEGAYVGTHRSDRAEDTRVVYLDQYSGAVLGDVGFAQYGAVGRAIDWGIAVHQGLEYGNANRAVMLAGCVAIVLLAVSALVMWWQRRPAGTIGLPPPPADPSVLRGLVFVTLPFAVLFPLLGGSLLAALGLDWLVVRLVARWPRARPLT